MTRILLTLLASTFGAPEETVATAPAAPALTDEALKAFWSPQDLVEAELIDDAIVEANVARSKSDAHFHEVSVGFRENYVLSRKRATRTPENMIAGNLFQLVATSGPDVVKDLVAYQKKKTSGPAVEAIPSWHLYILRKVLAKAEDLIVAEIEHYLQDETARKEVLANSEGLPENVRTYNDFMVDSGKYQFNYVVSERRIVDAAGNKFVVAWGGRNDVHRPVNEKKRKAKAAKDAAGTDTSKPDAEADAPDEEGEEANA